MTFTYDPANDHGAREDVEQSEFQTQISVRNVDCLEAAIDLIKQGFNPVVLNNASFKRPGGGYQEGAASQEKICFAEVLMFIHKQILPS